MLQRLPIALARVKARITSKNLLNKILKIIYSFYQTKEIILYQTKQTNQILKIILDICQEIRRKD